MHVWEHRWFAPGAFVVIVVGGLLSVALLGSQVSGVLSTVGSSVGGPGTVSGGDVIGGDQTGGDQTGGDTTSGDTSSSAGSGVTDASVRDDLLIIKTGTLTLQVDDIVASVTAATQQIDALDGYVSGSERSGAGEDARASIAFRIPASRWDEALTAIRSLKGEVVEERSTTEDVTSQVVDLGARIRNLQVTEQALQAIMDRAKVIKDVLTVQAELTTTRGQIEQLSAQKGHLEEQAAYSSLSVAFVRTPAPVLAVQQDQFDPGAQVDAASASLVGVLQGVATAGIWFGIVWLPILLALAIVAGIGVLITRRMLRTSLHRSEGTGPVS